MPLDLANNNVAPFAYHITDAPSPDSTKGPAGTMDDNMDIDIDMDTGEDEDVRRMREEAEAINARAQAQAQEAAQEDAMNGVEEAPEDGEVDPNAIVPFKVHLRGLDHLSQDQVIAALGELCNMELFKKLQWVDDTSANAIFDDNDAAADALAALSAEEIMEPLYLRAMKQTSVAPESQMQVRMAMDSDVKVRGAKDRSRYYLDHPEADPDGRQRNRRYDSRRGPRDRRPDRRTRYESLDKKHGRSRPGELVFTEDMYGDAPSPEAMNRRGSYSSASTEGRKRVNYGDDLVAPKDNGRLRDRDRSASPTRDGDGRYGFEDIQPYRRTATRQRTPPPPRRPRSDRLAGPDGPRARDQDLFANKPEPSALKNGFTNGSSNGNDMSNAKGNSFAKQDLFPGRSANSGKELLPNKASHHRQDARTIAPDAIADALSPGRAGGRPAHTNNSRNGGDLMDRISGGPQVGRLNAPTGPSADRGFSFKGAGNREEETSGFSFKGASHEPRAEKHLARELFPLKSGGAGANAGKELMGARRARGRAEDYN